MRGYRRRPGAAPFPAGHARLQLCQTNLRAGRNGADRDRRSNGPDIGNSLLRRDRCLAAAVPFDPQLGLSGGEDTIFLARLRERGRRIVWCAEAAVTEDIPEDKLAPGYLLRRAFRTGQTTAFLPSALAHPRWSAVLRWMLIGAVQVCIYGAWSIALRLLGRDAWLTRHGEGGQRARQGDVASGPAYPKLPARHRPQAGRGRRFLVPGS